MFGRGAAANKGDDQQAEHGKAVAQIEARDRPRRPHLCLVRKAAAVAGGQGGGRKLRAIW